MVVNINFRPFDIGSNKSTNGSTVNSASKRSANSICSTKLSSLSTSNSTHSSSYKCTHNRRLNSRRPVINDDRKRKQRTENGNDGYDQDVRYSDSRRSRTTKFTTYNSTQELTPNSSYYRKSSQQISRSISSLLFIFLIFILQSHLYHTQNGKFFFCKVFLNLFFISQKKVVFFWCTTYYLKF